ncbi:hypothetical protein L2E82_35684 [Cichorium intybus]|uniref:Uncharacterized protein n=1 Tax=Cichorium intybus TaxID=13427 RepID=A0ACB9BPL4_CICIN|nr:hypothetical protein L2E82_35684 [Cichorium intybus]
MGFLVEKLAFYPLLSCSKNRQASSGSCIMMVPLDDALIMAWFVKSTPSKNNFTGCHFGISWVERSYRYDDHCCCKIAALVVAVVVEISLEVPDLDSTIVAAGLDVAASIPRLLRHKLGLRLGIGIEAAKVVGIVKVMVVKQGLKPHHH